MRLNISVTIRGNLWFNNSVMIKASIVSIGDELLSGQTLDANAAYLSSKLLSLGIVVAGSYTVPDDIGAIVRVLKMAGNDAEVILVTGGLGPTADDLTRQALAEFLQRELVLDEKILQKIQGFFARRNLPMPAASRTQAYIPAGAQVLENNLGTAPGIWAEVKGKLLAALPGVLLEMEEMFEKSVRHRLEKIAQERQQAIEIRKLRCFGAGESTITELLGDICRRDKDPLVNFTTADGVVTLQIVAAAKDRNLAGELADDHEKLLRAKLGELIYGSGQQTLAQVVAAKLREKRKTVAVAESCTGGLLSKLITDIPGASEFFLCGWVAYSNKAKINELGIGADTIEKYGAVSAETADMMAKGARTKARTDFGIGITGIAGPGGAGRAKPAGLVYISIDCAPGCETKRFIFCRDRQFIRLQAAQTALNMLRLRL